MSRLSTKQRRARRRNGPKRRRSVYYDAKSIWRACVPTPTQINVVAAMERMWSMLVERGVR